MARKHLIILDVLTKSGERTSDLSSASINISGQVPQIDITGAESSNLPAHSVAIAGIAPQGVATEGAQVNLRVEHLIVTHRSPTVENSGTTPATPELIILSEVMIKSPELLIPQKKPVGSLTLDWGHPLTEGLVGFWVVHQGRVRDLVTGKNYDKNGGTYVVDSVGGEILDFPDSPSVSVDTGVYATGDMKTLVTLNTFHAATSPGGNIRCQGVHEADHRLYLGSYSTAYNGLFAYGTSYLQVSNTYMEDDVFYLSGMTNRGSNTYIFLDGSPLNSFASTFSGTSGPTLHFGGRGANTTIEPLYGRSSFMLVSKKEWTDADHKEFSLNPFQILAGV